MNVFWAAVAGVGGFVIGLVLGFIRDQGQPWYIPEEEKRRLEAEGRGGSKWKEAGLVLMALLLGGCVAAMMWRAEQPWLSALIATVAAGAFVAFVWSQGHKRGLDLTTPLDWLAMAGTGALMLIPLQIVVVVVWSAWSMALLWLLVGVSKAPFYWLAYAIRGRTAPWPHANAFAASAHGGLLVASAFGGVVWLG